MFLSILFNFYDFEYNNLQNLKNKDSVSSTLLIAKIEHFYALRFWNFLPVPFPKFLSNLQLNYETQVFYSLVLFLFVGQPGNLGCWQNQCPISSDQPNKGNVIRRPYSRNSFFVLLVLDEKNVYSFGKLLKNPYHSPREEINRQVSKLIFFSEIFFFPIFRVVDNTFQHASPFEEIVLFSKFRILKKKKK